MDGGGSGDWSTAECHVMLGDIMSDTAGLAANRTLSSTGVLLPPLCPAGLQSKASAWCSAWKLCRGGASGPGLAWAWKLRRGVTAGLARAAALLLLLKLGRPRGDRGDETGPGWFLRMQLSANCAKPWMDGWIPNNYLPLPFVVLLLAWPVPVHVLLVDWKLTRLK